MKITSSVTYTVAFLAMAAGHSVTCARAETITIALEREHEGVTRTGIAAAIEDAKNYFASSQNGMPDSYVIKIPAGTFDLTLNDSGGLPRGTIDVSRVEPEPGDELVIAGSGMDETVLIMDEEIPGIFGRSVYRVKFEDFEMTRKDLTVTQGSVVSVSPGQVILDIQPGFPTPTDIYEVEDEVDGRGVTGRYLREFTKSKTAPQLVTENNRQLAWRDAVQLPDHRSRWQFNLRNRRAVANYEPGDLVAVKSKHGGQAYRFQNGGEITFRRVLWTDQARGVFRNMNRITISDCRISRSAPINGQTPALSTPGGGPQIGQPRDSATSGNLVENLYAEGTGDDSIACFNCEDTTITGNHIVDSFARGILLFRSPDVQLSDNTLVRSPLQRKATRRGDLSAD